MWSRMLRDKMQGMKWIESAVGLNTDFLRASPYHSVEGFHGRSRLIVVQSVED